MMKPTTFSNTWTEFHDAKHCCVLSESFSRGFIVWPSSDDRNKAKILGHLLTRYNCRGWEWNFFWRWNNSSFVQHFAFIPFSLLVSSQFRILRWTTNRFLHGTMVVYEWGFLWEWNLVCFVLKKSVAASVSFLLFHSFYLDGWRSVPSLVMIKQILSFCLMLLKEAMRKKVWRPELKRASAAFVLVRFHICLLLLFFLRCDDATTMYMLDYGDVPWWSSVKNTTRIWAEL